MRAYTLNEDHDPMHGRPVTKGTLVYLCTGPDLGSAALDSATTGEAHWSFTLDKLGGYPFFTVPLVKVDPVEVDDLPALTHEHTDAVCKIGQGNACCRYLLGGAKGLECGKLNAEARVLLDTRVKAKAMVAQGDNCDGRSGNA